jgi:hypothetical protein
MATFNDLQKKGKGLSDIISKKVAQKAPIKTGRLRKALRRANTFDSMIELEKGSSKQLDVKGFTINIDYAPTDAEYGMFWNDPTVSETVKKGRTKNVPEAINFAEKALADAAVQRALDEMVDVIGEMVAAAISKEIDDLDK